MDSEESSPNAGRYFAQVFTPRRTSGYDTTMSESKTTGSGDYRTRLAIIFPVILLLCIGLAWWLVRKTNQGQSDAAAVVDAIRSRRLSSYWSDRPYVQWYLKTRNRTIVGWQLTVREPYLKGYKGLRIQVDRKQSGGVVGLSEYTAYWTLSDDLREGHYQGRSHEQARALDNTGKQITLVDEAQATIVQNLQRLEVTQTIQGRTMRSDAAIPGNYIPKDSSSLVFQEVLRMGVAGRFRFIQDNLPPKQNEPQWVRLHVQPAEEAPGAVLLSYVSPLGMGEFESRVFLDEDGNVRRRVFADADGVEETATASLEAVAREFPNAIKFAESKLGEQNFSTSVLPAAESE